MSAERQHGECCPSPTIVFLVFLAILSVVIDGGIAHADDSPQYGGCIVREKKSDGTKCDPEKERCICNLEAGVAVAVTVGRYENGKFSAGLLPGIGYGLVLFPERWYSLGLAVYGQMVAGGGPSEVMVSSLFSFARYVRFGLGLRWIDMPSSRTTSYLFGFGNDYGGSPAYLRKQN
jgi:hypothetical protein